MSPVVKDLIDKLLNPNPDERLGCRSAAEVKQHPFFKGIKWETLMTELGPFIPKLDSIEDTGYFNSRNADMPEELRRELTGEREDSDEDDDDQPPATPQKVDSSEAVLPPKVRLSKLPYLVLLLRHFALSIC